MLESKQKTRVVKLTQEQLDHAREAYDRYNLRERWNCSYSTMYARLRWGWFQLQPIAHELREKGRAQLLRLERQLTQTHLHLKYSELLDADAAIQKARSLRHRSYLVEVLEKKEAKERRKLSQNPSRP